MSAHLIRGALLPASWLYGLGWESYLGLYRLGFKRAAEPHKPVLVVGNLVVGGTGKSPMTRYIVELLSKTREVVIVSRGYGSPRSKGEVMLAPPGPLNPREWGDEPAMLRSFLPQIPLVVGGNRVKAAKIVQREFPNAVLVMDDGFQHLPLKKHVSVLLDQPNPKNTHCLPAGPYREPRFERKRADLVLGDQFKVLKEPLKFVWAQSNEPVTQTAISQSAVSLQFDVLCALGRPQAFLEDLRLNGVEIGIVRLLPDHDPLLAGTLLDGLGKMIVVTAKDWVKLKQRRDLDLSRIVVAQQRVSVSPPEAFEKWLVERLG